MKSENNNESEPKAPLDVRIGQWGLIGIITGSMSYAENIFQTQDAGNLMAIGSVAIVCAGLIAIDVSGRLAEKSNGQ